MSRSRIGEVRGRLDADGPLQATCEVLDRRREGSYWVLSFAAEEIAQRARPGQFVQIGVGSPGSLLRRPFSIAGVSPSGAPDTVEVVFDAHGPGTDWLTRVDGHDVIDVIGPLGAAFALPERIVSCLLVGGGYGAAPLFFLAERLSERGLRVEMVVGAASRDRILGVRTAQRRSSGVTFTTDDGSYGVRGRVTDVLAEAAERSGAGIVYACGPNPMLRAVSERCGELDLPVEVAVEERMACGIGICFTCVLPIRGRDGTVRMQRSCVDGPVFSGARIAWDVSRYGAGPATLRQDQEAVTAPGGPAADPRGGR